MSKFGHISRLEIIDILRHNIYGNVSDVITWSTQNIQTKATFWSVRIVTLRLFSQNPVLKKDEND